MGSVLTKRPTAVTSAESTEVLCHDESTQEKAPGKEHDHASAEGKTEDHDQFQLNFSQGEESYPSDPDPESSMSGREMNSVRIDIDEDTPGKDDVSHHDQAINEARIEGQQERKRKRNVQKMNPWKDHSMNPMKIDVVLEILFSFCSVRMLKNCRLVSKQWKDASLKVWRDKAVLCPGKNAEGMRNIQRYVKLLQSKFEEDEQLQLKKYPFRNFRIQSSFKEYLKDSIKPVSDIARHIILRDYKGPSVQFKKFLANIHSLQVLELENCDLEWNNEDLDVYFQPSNLKRLKLFRNVDPPETQIWEDLLVSLEKLESLTIEYRTPKDCVPDVSQILKCIRNIRTDEDSEDEDAMSLKELVVIHVPQTQEQSENSSLSNLDKYIIVPIEECEFPLESLTIHIVWDKNAMKQQVHPIYSLLDSCKKTLRYLNTSFIFDVSEETFHLHFQKRRKNTYTLRMKALKEVYLSNGLWGMNILAGLELPNLRKLKVDDLECIPTMEDIGQFQLPFPQDRVYQKLETVEFLDNRKVPGPKTVRAFAQIMPNLVNLTMPLDKYTFGIVCESFKGLKTLNAIAAQCRFEELDDESLTGIPTDPKFTRPRTRRPNITDLVYLTDVSIACETNLQGNAPFTDHSVVHGFLQLPRLHSLSIGFKDISDETQAKLLSHVRGTVNIKVKSKSMHESYCDVEIEADLISSEN